MDTLSIVATTLACLYLPVPFIMSWFHVFDGAWKRMGAWSYLLHVPVYVMLVGLTASLHGVFRASAWPWHPVARVAGGAVLAAAFALLLSTFRSIDLRTLMAVPQVTRAPGRALITGGAYARMRHPRYTVLMAASLGNFLFTGYELLLAAFCVTTAATLVMARLEERELVSHFGIAYLRYCAVVPAFFPRPRRRDRRTPA